MDPDEDSDRAAFAPRKSLARTPPEDQGAGSWTRVGSSGAGKRGLTSPEEVGSASQKPRVELRSSHVETPRRAGKLTESVLPPVAGILTSATREGAHPTGARQVGSLGRSTKLELMDTANENLQSVMKIVTGSLSRLNKQDRNAVSAHIQDTLAVIADLNNKLCSTELDLAEEKLKVAKAESLAKSNVVIAPAPTSLNTYASALKLAKKGEPTPLPSMKGPTLAFYPAPEHVDVIKTAEDTKAVLKKAIRPEQMEVQVDRVRKVGNAGVLVQTTFKEGADKLKSATPPTLRVAVPKARNPQAALRNLDGNPETSEFLDALYDQNLKDTQRTKTCIQKECKIYRKKGFRGTTTAILECPPSLRQLLIEKGRVYIGWQAVEACDHITVTCCNKCQLYGHHEKFCRAQEVVCGKCGESGHRRADCTSSATKCATCFKFGKPADGYYTMSRECPARQHAEQRSLSQTQYG